VTDVLLLRAQLQFVSVW